MDINTLITVPKDIQTKANLVRAWQIDVLKDPESEQWFQLLREKNSLLEEYSSLHDVRFAFRTIGLFMVSVINRTRKSVVTYRSAAIDQSNPIWGYTIDSGFKAALMDTRVSLYRAMSTCDNIHREKPQTCQCQVGVITNVMAEQVGGGLDIFMKHAATCPHIPAEIFEDVMYVLFGQIFNEILLHDKYHMSEWIEHWIGSLFHDEDILNSLLPMINADIQVSIVASSESCVHDIHKKVNAGTLKPTGGIEPLADIRVFFDNHQFKDEVHSRLESGELGEEDLKHLRFES